MSKLIQAGDRIIYREDGKEERGVIDSIYPNYNAHGTMYLVETQYGTLWPIWSDQIVRKMRRIPRPRTTTRRATA